jgi:voltage-gated potassium channel
MYWGDVSRRADPSGRSGDVVGTARWVRLALGLGLLAAIYVLVPVHAQATGTVLFRAFGALSLLVALAVGMVRQLRLASFDGDRHIDGLVMAIATATLTFALAFYVLDVRDPQEIAGLETRLDAVYFTASTMLTIGYGDVHATGQGARALVLLQMIFNVVFVAAAAGLLTSRVRQVASARVEAARARSEPPPEREG